MVQRTRDELKTDMEERLPTNDRGLITAAVMRNQITDMLDSIIMQDEVPTTTPEVPRLDIQTLTISKVLGLADMGKYFLVDSTDDLVITFPNNAQRGDIVALRRQNTGHVAWGFVAGASIQLPASKIGHTRIAERYGEISMSCLVNETGTSAIWSVAGITESDAPPVSDTTPDAFTLNDVSNAELNSIYTSNTILVKGIGAPTPISITGGTYSISGGAYTSSPGTVFENQIVTVRVTSSASNSTPVSATLVIGGVADTYTVTTKAVVANDTTPAAFNFPSATNVPVSSEQTSAPITVSGINTASPISVSNGTYSKNGGAYTSTPGSVNNGDIVRVRGNASSSPSTTTTVELTIGGVIGSFSITTAVAQDTTPNLFQGSLEDYSDVFLSTVYMSNVFVVSGINVAAPVTISGGEWSKDGGAFTSASGTVNAGQSIQLRTTSAGSGGTTKRVDITIGTVTGTWKVTTGATGEPVPSNGSVSIAEGMWKLNVPYDAAGKSYANSTSPGYSLTIWPNDTPDLLTLDNAYFDRQPDGSIIMICPTTGVTTSANTKYARTELRELLPDGSNEYDWTPANGGKLECELRVLEMPTLTKGSVNRVVIGQIHGPSDEMCRVNFHSNGKITFSNDKCTRPDGTTGEWEWVLKDSGGNQSAVSLGDWLSLKIEADDTDCTVTVVHFAGGGNKTYKWTTPLISFWSGKLCYFKTGAYLQVARPNHPDASNCGTGQARVHFRKITAPLHPWDYTP